MSGDTSLQRFEGSRGRRSTPLATGFGRQALGLTVLSLALLAGCSPGAPEGAGQEPPSAPPNILLITVDTLRADHLSAYGYPRQTSPVIDQLAADGVRFDRPAVQWPKTGPSFASIMTATYPKDNGIVRHVGIEVPCAFPMLAEQLKTAGYGTYAVVSNGALASELRFDQGFDVYVESWKTEEPAAGDDKNGAAAVNALTTAVLQRIDRSKPYFLWVHYLDPHFPYSPPAPFSDRFQNDEHFETIRELEIGNSSNQQMVQLGYGRVLDERTDLGFYVARYDAEIAYTDDHIGQLLDTMRAADLYGDDTLLAFTADHGESLGEHHYLFDHGRFGFQTCTRVPLIFHYPGQLPARVIEQPVGLIDLAPTLLDAAGIELQDGRWMQGQSLWPWMRGDAERPAQAVFSEAGLTANQRWQRLIQDERYKLIYARAPSAQRFIAGKDQPFALYDLDLDPLETENVADQHPEELERLKKLLWQEIKADKFDVRTEPGGCPDYQGLDGETRSLLESLGYL